MYEDIKEKLSMYGKYKEKLSEINEMIADIEYSKYCVNGIDYSKDRVQTSPRNDGIINAVARTEKLMKIKSDLNMNIRKSIDDIVRLAELCDDSFGRSVISDKYLYGKTLSQIAREQDCSYRWISKVFNRSLKKISERC